MLTSPVVRELVIYIFGIFVWLLIKLLKFLGFLGIKILDQDGDGDRDLPNGQEFRLNIQFATQGVAAQVVEIIAQNWSDVGVTTSIKEVTSDDNGGWVVPTETLTDSEIDTMASDKNYNVSAVHSGYTGTGLTGTEATAKVAEIRTEYAVWIGANTIHKSYAPTNEDMSGYV